MPVPTMLAMTMQVAVRSEIFCALPTNVRDLTLGCRQLGRCRQRLGREEVANVSLINKHSRERRWIAAWAVLSTQFATSRLLFHDRSASK